MLLALLIQITHWMIIIFMLVAPFSQLAPILILHITSAWCLLVHWVGNNDICFLSLVEAKLRKIPYQQGFLHQFVSPVYNISDKTLSQICYTVVITTMTISMYNLLENPEFQKALKSGSFRSGFEILFPI